MAGLATYQISIKILKMSKIKFMTSKEGYRKNDEDIETIFSQILNGFWKKEIETIREHNRKGNKVEADNLKAKLPAFTVSANYDDKREDKLARDYTGIIHLDYDYVEDPHELKNRLSEIPFTYAAFISPSGKGVKVFARCDSTIPTHIINFNALRAYYDNLVGVESDKTVKNVLRICFVSYDKDLYLNNNSDIFKHQSNTNVSLDYVWKFTSNKSSFTDGNRNNFMYSFGCNTNRYAFDKEDVIKYAYSYSDSTFSKDEIEKTIRSSYINNENENGSYAKPAILPYSSDSTFPIDRSPYIHDDIYQKLPHVIRESCEIFSGRERDVFFISALAVVSGGLYNVSGLYSQEEVYPNLFTFISAPAASGKGSMKYAGKLGECFQEILLEKSRENIKEYKKLKKLYDLKVKKARKPEDLDLLVEPEPPKSKVFFIPGDVSNAMLIKLLDDNEGTGCICETESDTVSNSWKQDWGGYSETLRKGFQGEPISRSRVTNLEYVNIKCPKFSVVLTGTPNQLDTLMTSVQDGLFSRFIYYTYTADSEWKTTYTEELQESKQTIFSGFSNALCDKFLSTKPQKFRMTREQGETLDNTFREVLGHNVALYREEVSGVIYRLGLMTYKIAMVLTALRSDDENLVCSDEDFNIAKYLVEKVFIVHSIETLNKIGKQSKLPNSKQVRLYEWITEKVNFTRAEIYPEAESLGIPDRTLTDILKKFVNDKMIKKTSHGNYSRL